MSNKYIEETFVPFITEHKENVYRLAYSYVRNSEDALDIVQESIHKAISSLEHMDDPSFLKSWFYRIVVNTSIDFLRKHKKIQVVDDETMELFSQGTEDIYHNIDLNRALDALPDKYRIIIILRFFEDLKIDEIAKVLHENTNTIKTRLYKALGMLREILKDDMYTVEE